MRFALHFLFIFIITSSLFSQQVVLKGTIYDSANNDPLRFANIRIDKTTRGTSANVEGEFELRLDKGNYRFITSFIGYKSDTLNLSLDGNRSINIFLHPIIINLPDVVVRPGDNPANGIIRKAIAAKHKRNEKLNSYIVDSYTKGLIKTTKDLEAGSNSVSIDIAVRDTADLKITGILENQNRGYFKKPDYYKDEIIARKQTANAPPTINLLTGGRLLQNFYSDDIQFFNRPLPSPISDDALDFYYFLIEDQVAMDNLNIYEIYFLPKNDDPGFEGRVYIADSLFTLMKVDVWLNRAANPGGLLDTVSIFQQFLPFEEDIFMPIDYRLNAEGNFLGIAKFGFELHSIFYNYEINTVIDDDIFDMAVLKVLPDADDKEAEYWTNIEKIPNTEEELLAYNRIDSTSSIPQTFWDNFSLLSKRTKLNDNLYTSGLLSMYHFTNVEGHVVDFSFFIDDSFDKRLNCEINLSYGFSDNKFKKNLSFEYLLGDYRTTRFAFNVFDNVNDLFGESNYYNKLTSTLTSWLGKYDFRDYYYSEGFNFTIGGEVFPFIELEAGYSNRTDRSGFTTSNFSILNETKNYRSNKLIYETIVNALTAGVKLDFRKYIEDGDFRRRISNLNSIPVLSIDALFSNKSLLNSDLNFALYKMILNGSFFTFKSAQLNYELRGTYSTGSVPYQMLYALPGNIETGGKNFSFRTLRLGEVASDRYYAIMLMHDFRDELFRAIGIPLLKDLELSFAVHFNMAWAEISKESIALLPPGKYIIFNTPFYEAGFSIGHMLIPFELEFTWKLNHFGGSNFAFGFNTFAL